MALCAQTSLLGLPCELRNAIYHFVYERDLPEHIPQYNEPPNPLALALKLSHQRAPRTTSACSNPDLRVLQTCKQMYHEASLLALSQTTFHLTGETVYPESFAKAVQHLSFAQQASLRHVTLTARISHLRALNEAWGGLPFGHAGLDLDSLTIVPRKPDASHSAYAEVADLSQSHTLAYVLAETLKRLRNVRVVQVRNHGCFSDVVWSLVYRSLVYRMWRWGGECCGLRFECPGEESGEQWFRVWLAAEGDKDKGCEVGDEVIKMIGGKVEDRPDPNLAPDPNIVGF